MVDEPTVEDTISILRGLKDRYEVFHGVKITDGALVSAATLSDRYISDRFLPDKAIDLVDEACAMIKTELDSMPAELDEKRRKIMHDPVFRRRFHDPLIVLHSILRMMEVTAFESPCISRFERVNPQFGIPPHRCFQDGFVLRIFPPVSLCIHSCTPFSRA